MILVNKILIIEDDLDIIRLLTLYLKKEGYEVFYKTSGIDGYNELINNDYDILLLDIMLPGMDGFKIIEKSRKYTDIPIIVLSAKSKDESKILGLDLGADDYVSKPFNPLEVVSRVNAQLRRNKKISQKEIIKNKELTLDTKKMIVMKNGLPLSLTATEYKILHLLMSHPGQVFSKYQICEQINGEFFESDESVINVHIFNLREKIEDKMQDPIYIKTVRGMGYKFEK